MKRMINSYRYMKCEERGLYESELRGPLWGVVKAAFYEGGFLLPRVPAA